MGNGDSLSGAYPQTGTILNSTDLPVRDCVSGSSCLSQENSLRSFLLIPSLSRGSVNLGYAGSATHSGIMLVVFDRGQ